nr:CAZy families GT2 protein [uncultured Faecalibacterium sp.]
MKKISVVIPVYNVAEFLPTCLDSLVHQTFPSQDYEVLLVDDGIPIIQPKFVSSILSVIRSVAIID